MLEHYAPKKEESKGTPVSQLKPGMLKSMFGGKKAND